jgi:hypothetical protein
LGEIVLNLGIALRAPNNGKSNPKKLFLAVPKMVYFEETASCN